MAGVTRDIRLPSIEALLASLGPPRSLTPNEDDVLQEAANRVLAYVQAAWPVDTGTSDDNWTVEISGDPGSLGFTISNPIDYVSFVHPAGTGAEPEGWYWQELTAEAWLSVRGWLLSNLDAEIRATDALAKAQGGNRQAYHRLYTQPVRVARAVA